MNIFRHLRNFFIASISFLGIVKTYQMIVAKRRPLVRVLVFHDVADAVWFQKILAFIDERYHVLTPQEFAESQFDRTRINILITFDDGYSSWVDVCLPQLSARSIKALFFLNSGLIDVSEDSISRERYIRERLLLSPRAILSWDGVRTLTEEGHTIGGHTVTHTRLSLLQEREQRDEILHDKERIVSKTGTVTLFFAYPFGQHRDYTEVTKRIVKEAGYRYAFTTEGIFARMDDTLAVSRLCLENDMKIAEVKRWIEGGYDVYQKLKKICVR